MRIITLGFEMCIGAEACTMLSENPEKWSKHALLLPPSWFEGELDHFTSAVREAAFGSLVVAEEILSKIRNNDLREWFIEHGQNSGGFRHKGLGKPLVTTASSAPDNVRLSNRIELEVFERDGYRCRYCGVRLVSKKVLGGFSKLLGREIFCATGTNKARHGAVLAFRAGADHVVPWKRGGATATDNLVSTCWSCNFGKSNFTLDQIGLHDPRNRPANPTSSWDGLISLDIPLRRQIKLKKKRPEKTTVISRLPSMIRVILPYHLRTLAQVGAEVQLEVEGEATLRSALAALEARYPMLRGTIRDHVTLKRRPMLRFYGCAEDLSHESPDAPLPAAIASGAEPLLIVGAIAGG